MLGPNSVDIVFPLFKGTVRVILSDPPCQDGHARFTLVNLKALYDLA